MNYSKFLKKVWEIINKSIIKFAIAIISIAVFAISFSNTVSAAEDNETDKTVILIDPGHGGADGGAKSKSGVQEKGINLSISIKLKDKLEQEGYEVYMTREDDIALSSRKRDDLEARCNMKKETNCDAFISIHQNKFGNSKCFGAQVWYSEYKDSQKFALDIQNSLKDTINDNNKRIPKAAKKQYKILRDGYEAPAVIVECGFISNYNEEQKLQTDEYQQQIVLGIVNGVNTFFEK